MSNDNQKINYNRQTKDIINLLQSQGKTPTLLLHCCCAPCASYCLDYLSKYFQVTLFYFNPNIFPQEEYQKRLEELKKLQKLMPTLHPVGFLDCEYDPQEFFSRSKGFENLPEGGQRCNECFSLRLEKTAETAQKYNFDYFCTTLTISPLKDSQLINKIGTKIALDKTTAWLPSDFKKDEGYKKSVELSQKYGLYRQNFCGCIYSATASKK